MLIAQNTFKGSVEVSIVSEAQPARFPTTGSLRINPAHRIGPTTIDAPTNHSGASTYRLTIMAMTKAAADEQIPTPSFDEL